MAGYQPRRQFVFYTIEGGKRYLAEELHESFSLYCPACTNQGFIRDQAGKSTKDGLKRLQFKCKWSNSVQCRQTTLESCPRLSVSRLIDVAKGQLGDQQFRNVVERVCQRHPMQQKEYRDLRDILGSIESINRASSIETVPEIPDSQPLSLNTTQGENSFGDGERLSKSDGPEALTTSRFTTKHNLDIFCGFATPPAADLLTPPNLPRTTRRAGGDGSSTPSLTTSFLNRVDRNDPVLNSQSTGRVLTPTQFEATPSQKKPSHVLTKRKASDELPRTERSFQQDSGEGRREQDQAPQAPRAGDETRDTDKSHLKSLREACTLLRRLVELGRSWSQELELLDAFLDSSPIEPTATCFSEERPSPVILQPQRAIRSTQGEVASTESGRAARGERRSAEGGYASESISVVSESVLDAVAEARDSASKKHSSGETSGATEVFAASELDTPPDVHDLVGRFQAAGDLPEPRKKETRHELRRLAKLHNIWPQFNRLVEQLKSNSSSLSSPKSG